jgi:hypothetical protein
VARTARRTDGRLRRVLTGLGAVAILLTLLALPYLLALVAGNPLRGLPAPGELWSAITTRDDGQLFLRALALVAWAALAVTGWYWLTFAVAVIVEIPAQIRGRRTVSIPGLRLQQRLASALVAAVASAILNPALSATAITAVAVAPAVTTVQQPVPAAARVDLQAERHPSDYLTHEIQRGESLLGLSERYGVPMADIAAANHDLKQPDGRALQPGHTRIYPGWTLRIPLAGTSQRHAAGSIAPAAHTSATRPVYAVAPGDWLWHIAGRFLGDPDRYAEIADLNPGLERRDHRFPDHIEATWHVVLPADAHDHGPRRHATGHLITPPQSTAPPDAAQPNTGPDATDQPGSGTGAGGNVTTPIPTGPPTSTSSPGPSLTPSPSTQATAAASPSAATSATPTATADPTTITPAGKPDQAPADHNSGLDAEDVAVVSAVLAGAGLLGALILRTVGRRRRRQQQHRRYRRRLPNPRGGATERKLRVAEQPADVDRLDAALRHLAATLDDPNPAHLPDIIGAWITGGTIQLLLTRRCDNPPPPWVDEGHQWTLPGSAALPAVPDQVAPLPTLVAVGSQPGRHLLIDLERLGALTIGGDHERALALLRYLVSELACNSWSDEVDITIAGFDTDESEQLVALNPDRITATASVPEAVTRLRRRLASTRASLSHTGLDDTFAARVGDIGDAWPPQVLLVADPTRPAQDALAELHADLAHSGRGAVAIAITQDTTELDHCQAAVTADGELHLRLPNLTTATTAAGLPSNELAPLAEIMRTAREAVDEPTPPAAETESWAQGTDAAGSLLDLFTTAEPTGQADEQAATPEPEPPDRTDDPADQADQPPPTAPPPETTETVVTAREPITSTSVAAVAAPPRRAVTAAIRQRSRQADPHLDRDLHAWQDDDPTRPRIGVLGPVTIDAPGPRPEHRQRFHAEIIVYLAQRSARGADRARLEDALWPDRKIKDGSLRVAMTRARRWLGDTPDGQPWLPEMASDRTYRLADGVLLDWHLFRRLRSRGEAHGTAGTKDLRTALDLVRGAPLDGADRAYAAGARNPYTWLPESDLYPPHIVAAVVDTAHQLAQLYLEAGDTAGARWAVQRAWLADPYRGDDELWHDIMHAEHLDGHTAELRQLLGELIQAREAEVPEDLQPATYRWLRSLAPDLLHASTPVA